MPILTPTEINARSLDYTDKQLEIDRFDFQNGVTALAGGGQANAIVVSKPVTRVTTVGTAGDSVKLPRAVPGTQLIVIINAAAANSMNVFPSSGDAVNALAGDAAFAVAANKTVMFFCAVAGTWNAIVTA
jgi:hypothetical protein